MKTNNKQTIRISESKLRRIIKESVQKIMLKERDDDEDDGPYYDPSSPDDLFKSAYVLVNPDKDEYAMAVMDYDETISTLSDGLWIIFFVEPTDYEYDEVTEAEASFEGCIFVKNGKENVKKTLELKEWVLGQEDWINDLSRYASAYYIDNAVRY